MPTSFCAFSFFHLSFPYRGPWGLQILVLPWLAFMWIQGLQTQVGQLVRHVLLPSESESSFKPRPWHFFLPLFNNWIWAALKGVLGLWDSDEQRLSGLCALRCIGTIGKKLNAVAFKVLIFYLEVDGVGSTHDYRGSHHRVSAIVLQRRAVGMTDYGQRELSS